MKKNNNINLLNVKFGARYETKSGFNVCFKESKWVSKEVRDKMHKKAKNNLELGDFYFEENLNPHAHVLVCYNIKGKHKAGNHFFQNEEYDIVKQLCTHNFVYENKKLNYGNDLFCDIKIEYCSKCGELLEIQY